MYCGEGQDGMVDGILRQYGHAAVGSSPGLHQPGRDSVYAIKGVTVAQRAPSGARLRSLSEENDFRPVVRPPDQPVSQAARRLRYFISAA